MSAKVELEPIQCWWTILKGRWDPAKNSFVDRKQEQTIKTLQMSIEDSKDIQDMTPGAPPAETYKTLRFHGGPTGHESYRLQDILDNTVRFQSARFCICAGTINRWPACHVPWSQVNIFLRLRGYDK